MAVQGGTLVRKHPLEIDIGKPTTRPPYYWHTHGFRRTVVYKNVTKSLPMVHTYHDVQFPIILAHSVDERRGQITNTRGELIRIYLYSKGSLRRMSSPYRPEGLPIGDRASYVKQSHW